VSDPAGTPRSSRSLGALVRQLRKAWLRPDHDQALYELPPEPFGGWQPGHPPRATDSPPGSPRKSAGHELGTAVAPRPVRLLGHGLTGDLRHAPGDQPPRLAVAADTSAVGKLTQDAYFAQTNLAAVARGLTGTDIDQRAATLALGAVLAMRPQHAEDPAQALREAASAANRTICAISRRDPQLPDMVTTLDVVMLSAQAGKLALYYAHAGNSTIWLQRADGSQVRPLTKAHAFAGGPLLRAVGLAPELTPDVAAEPVSLGDRVFIATESADFRLTREHAHYIADEYAHRPLRACVAALISLIPAGAAENVTVVAAEIGTDSRFDI